ncbi:hydroxyethylthiazole kinase [Heyndrickxia acidiproducens]|uniref:hydroxyethylthiazole kinase n=1 Tax=Heyndrickxia acidiproducens TaxID=1121084 RepID=UPI000376552B|nr:hydroxyethylthiazole kinase [Heyndrickxia acidiproducens]
MEKTKPGELIEKIRKNNPLIHNITNIVVANFTANGLLALGASPVMADAVEETAEMAIVSDAVVLNIGTLNEKTVEAMILAGKSANQHGVPVVLDPVGAGATQYRTEIAQKLINTIHFSVIRGNAAEIANLIGIESDIKGVDAANVNINTTELALEAARKLKATVAVSGKIDAVSNDSVVYLIHNGHPILTKVTGTGCLLSSVCGAFLAVEKDPVIAAASALTTYGVAGEIARRKIEGDFPGSFQIEFLNQLSSINQHDIEHYGSYKLI